MWNLANDYNLPINQKQRLKDAGLNPALMYKNGAGSGGNTSTTQPKYNAIRQDYNYKAVQVPQAISMFQDLKMKNAQIDNVQAQTQNIQTRTGVTRILESLTGTKAEQAGFSLKKDRELYPYQKSVMSSKQDQEIQRMKNMVESGKLTKQQIKSVEEDITKKSRENSWRKEGITPQDNVLFRIMLEYFKNPNKQSNMSMEEWEKSFQNQHPKDFQRK